MLMNSRALSALTTISLSKAEACRVREGRQIYLGSCSLLANQHAEEMLNIGQRILEESLSPNTLDAICAFGRGDGAPALLIQGIEPPEHVPPTPTSGYDLAESEVQELDIALFGAFRIAGIWPIAFNYENFGQLIRNVVANPAKVRERSSHGAEELVFHTDNCAGEFEIRGNLNTGKRAPIPRFLGFVCARNADANGFPVPTEILAVDEILDRTSPEVIAALKANEFLINPPKSNSCARLESVPLICEEGGRNLLRFNAGEDQVRGMTDRAIWAKEQLTGAIWAAEQSVLAVNLAPADILIFDNYRVLHKRRSFSPGENWAESRWLRRCFACLSLQSGYRRDPQHQRFVFQNPAQ